MSSAGSAKTIKAVNTVNNVVTGVSASAPGTSSLTGEVVYMAYTENTETLSFKRLAAPTGAAVTTSNESVKTGDGTYVAQHGANDFSGTSVYLSVQAPKNQGTCEVTGTISATTSGGAYTPDKVKIGVNYDKTTSVTQGTKTDGTVTKVVTPYTGS